MSHHRGGSGGYAAARTAAGAGLKTVVIEGGREVAGFASCALHPTKACSTQPK